MNRNRAWSAAAAPLWIASVALSGCGGAAVAHAPAAPEPAGATVMSTQEEGSPRTAEDALAELERAEGELDRVLGAPAGGGEGRIVAQSAPPGEASPAAPSPAAQPPATAPAPPPAPDSAPRATAAGRERPSKKAEADQVSAAPCETACRALASMSRAAQHLCGLAGDADQRCDAARTRVKSATDRVEAQCPRCAEP
ncbi:PASTA domain-containing protein [Sorangium sp. So ce1128]